MTADVINYLVFVRAPNPRPGEIPGDGYQNTVGFSLPANAPQGPKFEELCAAAERAVTEQLVAAGRWPAPAEVTRLVIMYETPKAHSGAPFGYIEDYCQVAVREPARGWQYALKPPTPRPKPEGDIGDSISGPANGGPYVPGQYAPAPLGSAPAPSYLPAQYAPAPKPTWPIR